MRLTISHSSVYRYASPVPYGLQELRLTPRSGPSQRVTGWETVVEGGVKQVSFDDQYMNRVDLVRLASGTTEVSVVAEGEVETIDTAGVVAHHDGFAPLWLFRRETPLTAPGSAVRRLARGLDRAGSDWVAMMHTLSARIREEVEYETGTTGAESTAEDALAAGRGVCQDHAHIFVTAARHLGHPARYVSGYLMLDDRVDQDASHAWAEVWIEGLGWVGFDVSNGISPDERYVGVARGLDYRDAAPISGVRFGSGDEELHVSVQVQQ